MYTANKVTDYSRQESQTFLEIILLRNVPFFPMSVSIKFLLGSLDKSIISNSSFLTDDGIPRMY